MLEYEKIKKVKKLSNFVGCLKRFNSGRVSLLILIIHFILIILSFMNLFIVPWSMIKHSLLVMRIIILSLLGVSLICISYNMIIRKRKKLKVRGYYCFGIFGSILSTILIVLVFILILISIIVIAKQVKKIELKKRRDYNSIIAIDIFSLVNLLAVFFLWYYEILTVYTKINYDESIKEYIDEKTLIYNSQNAKIVNVEIGSNNDENDANRGDTQAKHLEEEETISNNKIELSSEKMGTKKGSNIKNNEKMDASGDNIK